MGDKHPPYMLAWTGSYQDVQELPKAMRRVLQHALTDDRDDPGRFLVGMGRLLRFCDIGTPPRRRSRSAAAAALANHPGIESCLKLSHEVSRVFSKAFRAVRYRERHVWEDVALSPGMALVLARDDLESLSEAVRRGVPVPDAVTDQALRLALRDLRATLEDHLQTMDALHDDDVCRLMAPELAKRPHVPEHDFLDCLVGSEPVRWWLAAYHLNRGPSPTLR